MLFGGALGTTAPCANDVWILTNPSRRRGRPAWSELPVSGELPPPRAEHWAVWVPARRRMIVFGGHDCVARRMNDTWVLDVPADGDGARLAWRRVADTGEKPPPRSHHTAVYDEAGDRVIVMGGYADQVIYDDVWELKPASSDAPAWRQLRVRGRGPTLSAHRAAWDPVRAQMLVFGGTSATGPDPDNPVWVMRDELDGSVKWRRLEGLRTSPPLRWSHGMVYSSSRDQLIVFGGVTSGGVLNDAWVLMNANAR